MNAYLNIFQSWLFHKLSILSVTWNLCTDEESQILNAHNYFSLLDKLTMQYVHCTSSPISPLMHFARFVETPDVTAVCIIGHMLCVPVMGDVQCTQHITRGPSVSVVPARTKTPHWSTKRLEHKPTSFRATLETNGTMLLLCSCRVDGLIHCLIMKWINDQEL